MAIKFSHQSNMKIKFLEKSTLFKQNYLTLCSMAKLRDWGSRVSIKFIEIELKKTRDIKCSQYPLKSIKHLEW